MVYNMLLWCPRCGEQHVDAPEPAAGWTNPPHRSHQCHGCGCIWRPADFYTNGITGIGTSGAADTYQRGQNLDRKTAMDLAEKYCKEAQALREHIESVEALKSTIETLKGHNKLLKDTQSANEPGLRKAIGDLYANGAALSETSESRLRVIQKKNQDIQQLTDFIKLYPVISPDHEVPADSVMQMGQCPRCKHVAPLLMMEVIVKPAAVSKVDDTTKTFGHCRICGEEKEVVGGKFVQHRPRVYVDHLCTGSGQPAGGALFVEHK